MAATPEWTKKTLPLDYIIVVVERSLYICLLKAKKRSNLNCLQAKEGIKLSKKYCWENNLSPNPGYLPFIAESGIPGPPSSFCTSLDAAGYPRQL